MQLLRAGEVVKPSAPIAPGDVRATPDADARRSVLPERTVTDEGSSLLPPVAEETRESLPVFCQTDKHF